jgi:endoglucanase
MIEPWKKLQKMGVGVHVGEFGAYNKTPHAVVLAWMRELMMQWKEAGWGWAMWNFRGAFGILDSNREDVNYEDFKGHKLDRAMLEMIREY